MQQLFDFFATYYGYFLFAAGIFVMAASCYLLFITSDPLEQVGGRLGKLLHLPEDVIASTFQALATSGPEIVMAILAATAFVAANSSWDVLTMGERGCSGCLNMCFSAMDNLLGIGCVGMIFMMFKKYIKGDEVVAVAPSVKIGLVFYLVSSSCLCTFIQFSSFDHTLPGVNIQERDGAKIVASILPRTPAEIDGRLQKNDQLVRVGRGADSTMQDVKGMPMEDVVHLLRGEVGVPVQLEVARGDEATTRTVEFDSGRKIKAHSLNTWQAWVLMSIGIAFIISQFFLPALLNARHARRVAAGLDEDIPEDDEDEEEDEDEAPIPTRPLPWLRDLVGNGFIYAFLVFALVVFVRECLGATFNMATVGIVSVGGVLIMFTSYVSSFPEFMMTYRYAVANKKSALLGMLFGSNVIDLAFAGYRAIRLEEPMDVYTTGVAQYLFPLYLWCLPTLALVILIAINKGLFKYKHAYPLVFLYLIYIISGFILL